MRTIVALTTLALAASVSACGSGGSDKKDLGAAVTSPSAAATSSSAAAAPSSGAGPAHRITVEYEAPVTDDDATAKQILDLGGLQGIADGFSTSFKLPQDLTIVAKPGEDSPFYDPQTKSVTLYYGFVTLTKQIIQQGDPEITDEELGKEWAADDDFILIHELGHAFVDLFQLPITGREEDAVDGLATVFFVDDVKNGAEYAFDAANFFHLLQGVQGEPDATQFQDEHSLSEQRAYDIACSVAGSSDETMQEISQLGILSDDRLARCPSEYKQKHDAWTKLLKPYVNA